MSNASQLEQLKQFTKVVADTGDFESMREFKPQDATTNPSLILQAATKPQYAHIIDKVIADRKNSGLTGSKRVEDIIDNILIAFGLEILKIVPGRVSTETDARLSFDADGTVAKARELIEKANAGEDFGRLALQYSQAQSALERGKLGWRKGSQLSLIHI